MPSPKHGPGFHHIAIRAFDFDKTVRFYRDAFGFEKRYEWNEAPNRAIMLDTGDGNYVEVFEGRKQSDIPVEGAILHYAIRVRNCDEAYDRAVAHGAVSRNAPANVDIKGDYPVTVRIAFVTGLDGEIIEFFENDEL